MAFNLADMSHSCIISPEGKDRWKERPKALCMQIFGPGLSGLTSVPGTTEGETRLRERERRDARKEGSGVNNARTPSARKPDGVVVLQRVAFRAVSYSSRWRSVVPPSALPVNFCLLAIQVFSLSRFHFRSPRLPRAFYTYLHVSHSFFVIVERHKETALYSLDLFTLWESSSGSVIFQVVLKWLCQGWYKLPR